MQIVFALRDQDDHAVVLPAETIESGISVLERGTGTDGWEEIDYSETSFFVHTAENIDLEVVFVLDFTNSMYEARLPDGRTGIDAMLDAFDAALSVLPSAHRVGVVEFHDRNVDPSVLSPLTTDRASIRSNIARFANSGFDHGSSRVWDGVARGMNLFSSVGANPRAVRALVFLSDGRDTSSLNPRDSLAGIAADRRVQLYAMGVGDVFQSSALRSISSQTGGTYYAAQNVSRLQTQLQLLVNDLRGQYQLTYITLRRTGEYHAQVQLRHRGLSADTTVGPFDVATFFGPDNQGVVSTDPPTLDRAAGTANVFVRARHMPRNIDRIRFSPGTSKPVSVELVGAEDGGILEGWNLSGPDGAGYYEASSNTPIEFGDSGLLFKLRYSDITERGLRLPLEFDDSIYSGGKRLVGVGDVFVGEQPRILFVSRRDGDDNEIYVMNADGTGVVRLTDNTVHDNPVAWSPDGTRILFERDRDGGEYERDDLEIHVMNADGTGVVRLTNNSVFDYPVAWSPDGSRILFIRDPDGGEWETDDMEIYVMNADGTGVVRLTDNSVYDWPVAWSPDGTRVLFVRHPDEGEWDSSDREIYVMNADGTGVVRLTDNSVYDWPTRWSPDGSRILFVSRRDGDDNEIYVMNADGTGVVRLTNNSVYDWPTRWSPDGSRILFLRDPDGGEFERDDHEIYVMNADGSGVVRLTDNSVYDVAVAWSPDGTRILFRRDPYGGEIKGDDFEIYVMNADGTGVVRLTDNSVYDYPVAWSP